MNVNWKVWAIALTALVAWVSWSLSNPSMAGEPTPQSIIEAREQLAATVGSVSAPRGSATDRSSSVSADILPVDGAEVVYAQFTGHRDMIGSSDSLGQKATFAVSSPLPPCAQ